jgi:erythritol kinase (D-erythritol 1-phosphate-forming)
MMAPRTDLIVGIDAGTSVIKAVAYDFHGAQVGCAATPNQYDSNADGRAVQSLTRTWADCARTLRVLVERIPDLPQRVAAIAVTGQGDGTWLVGRDDAPVGDAWLWLDARAAPTVQWLRGDGADRARFEATGTGLAACQQGAQLAHMAATAPDLLRRAEVALHCKDWLYLKLTGKRRTDPSEASFTFGNFRTRDYDDTVIDALGLRPWRHLLPPIVDGVTVQDGLTPAAAAETGLLAGTPVALGFVDIVSTGLGAGIYLRGAPSACSVVGSTGMHMRATRAEDVVLNAQRTGYVIALPVPGMVAQIQSNMAATLNIDWLLNMAGDLIATMAPDITRADLVAHLNDWLLSGRAGQLIYHPYISRAGERGPFLNPSARASLVGLSVEHRFADIVRAVAEGLGMAARDCYQAMGPVPREVRLTGGAVRSRALRTILSAAIGAPVRVCSREETGAAGAAMVAAVGIGAFRSMDDCLDDWVAPCLGTIELPDAALTRLYAQIFETYDRARHALEPVWEMMAPIPPIHPAPLSADHKRTA